VSAGYLAALAALWINRSIPWCVAVLAGAALNSAAILANGGRMPVAPSALGSAGAPLAHAVVAGGDPRHVLARPGAPLALLGDTLALGIGGVGLVVSPGDLVMAIGLAALVQAAMRAEASVA